MEELIYIFFVEAEQLMVTHDSLLPEQWPLLRISQEGAVVKFRFLELGQQNQ